MKRFASASGLAILLVLACDEPVSLPPTGSISIRFQSPTDAASVRLDPEDRRGARREPGRPVSERPEDTEVPEIVRAADEAASPLSHFTEYHIRLQGQSNKDTTVSAGATSVTLSGIAVGTYAVIVEGLVNDSVDYYGRADGVQVSKGATAEADLRSSFQSVRPTLTAFSATPTTDLRVLATFTQVAIATSYRVEWDDNVDFVSPVTNVVGASQTSADVTVSDSGTYQVRVFAVTSAVSNVRPSDAQILRVRRDGVGDDPSAAPGLRTGFGAVTDTLKNLNITPAGEEDWFGLTACLADTLIIETRAQRLTPPSPLNTVLRLFRSNGTTQVGATNDNLDGNTTDSRIQINGVPAQDTFRIEVTGGNTTGHYQLIFQVKPGPNTSGTVCIPRADPTYSLVSVAPASITAGQTSTFTLTARDQTNAPMTTGGAVVAFGVSGQSNGTIGTVTDQGNGTYTATFTGETSGTASTVTATIGGVAVTTTLPTITVTPGTLNKLGFTVPPSSATAGSSIAPTIEVAAQDAFGNLIAGASGVVTMTIQSNPGAGTLFGSVSKPLVGGLARFDDLKIDKAADGYTLRATSGSLTPATSSGFSIVAAAATRLGFLVQPTNITGGDSIKPGIQVAVRDGFGNTVTGFSTSITLVFSNNPGGGTLGGTLTRNTSNGIATFDDVNVSKIANGYILKAGTPILDSATSSAFNVALGPPKRLLFTVEPGDAAAGEILAPSVKVTVTDNGGNTVTTASDSVAMGFGIDPTSGAATLSGTKKVKPVSGVATFSNLSIDKSATGYALQASAGAITPDTTAPFTILPGVPYKVAFQVQPASVGAGSPIAPSVTVVIQDGFSNPVTTAGNFVTLAIGTNPPGDGSLDGTVTRQAVGGTATFNDLTLDKIGNGYTLTAESSGLLGATSTTFNVTASTVVSPTQSTAIASPSTDVVADNVVEATITVTVRDGTGNPMQGQTVQLSATGTGNTITQPAGTTSVGGVATGAIKSTKAELKTITVTVNPGSGEVVLNQQPTVLFIANAASISASLSAAVANPASPATLPNDGVQQSTITVTVRDANSNPVPDQNVQLATTGAGTFTQPGTTNASGVAVGGITSLSAGSNTVTVTVNPGVGEVVLTTQPVVDFVTTPCGDPNALQSTVAVSQDTTANGTAPVTVTVTVKDCGGLALNGHLVQIAASGSGNSVTPPTATSAGGGLATFTLTSTVAQSKTITTTINPGASQRVVAQQPTVVFKPGPATGLAFKVQPVATTAGALITPAVQVAVVDAQGNTVPGATNSISMVLSSGTLFGTTPVNALDGVATFADLSVQTGGIGYTLQAAATGLGNVTSNAFTITPAAAAALGFKVQPTNVAAGASINPAVEVKVVDQYGNTVTSATTSITVAIGTNGGVDSAGVLSGTKTKSATAGVASFTNLNVNRRGPGYTLAATGGGLTAATSTAFNVTAGAPFQLRFKVEPVNTTAGATIAPAMQVAVQDAFGNTVDTVGSDVTVSFYTDPTGSATLGGTATQPASSGIATFGNLSITKAATGYRLKATKGTLTQGLSAAFNINPAAAFKLAFTVEPATAAAGSAISPPVQVTVRDIHGNTVTGFGDSVAVAILANPGSGVLSGTKKDAPTAGVVNFSTLSINSVGTGYTLTATTAGVNADTSAAFNITAAAPSKLGFIVQPTSATAGNAVAPAIQVAVQDGLGNTVLGTTNAVTLSILDNPGGSTLFGTTTVAAENGIATFSNVSLDKAGLGYTLEASTTGLAKDTSDAFNVTAGSPSAATSTVSANPTSDVVADGVQTSTITVTVRDPFGNPVSGQAVTLASSGTGNTIVNPSSNTDLSGVATGTIASTVAEIKTVSATVGGSLAITQTASVQFKAGVISPSLSTVEVSPPTLAADGVASATVTVTVQDNSNNPVPDQTVEIAVTGSGNVITQPGITNALGVASGSVKSTGAGVKTVTATVNPGAGQSVLSQQPTVTFTAGPPAQLGFTVNPTSVAAGSVISPSIEVTVQDAQGNKVDAATSTVSLSIDPATGPPGAALYGAPPQAAVSGVATFASVRVDSAATGYRLLASATGLTTGTSATFDVSPGPVFTVTVSPSADSIFTLGGNKTFAAVARDSVGNLIPSTPFSWISSNEPVATVDGFGTATAQARGLSTIQASSSGKFGSASLAVAIRLGGVGNDSLTNAPSQVFASGDLPGRYAHLTPAEFNALMPAELRAAYDVLLFQWSLDAAANADWVARLRPYLALGGGVLFESPNNVADLSPLLTGAQDVLAGDGIALFDVPSLTDGILNQFVSSYLTFTDWSDSLAYFIMRGPKAIGLYGRFVNGCMVVSGPPNALVGSRGDADPKVANAYDFYLKSVRFAADCPLQASPGTPVSVRVFPKSVEFTDAGQTQQLKATALDDIGTPVPGAPITWFTLNDSVATVDVMNGLVTSFRDGQAHIGASGSGFDYSVASVAKPAAAAVNAWGTEVPANTLATSYLFKIWGPASNNLFAVGDGSWILRFNGTDWDSLANPLPTRMWGVWGFSAGNAYAVGDNGVLLHWDGANWTSQSHPAAGYRLTGVWGSGPNDVWVVGNTGRILHSTNGLTWTDHSMGTVNLWSIWGTAWNDIWAVGDGGTILHYDGVSWSGVTSPVAITLAAVSGSGANNVFAVGWFGDIARYNGTAWVSQPAPVSAEMWGVWTSSSNEAIAVGRGAVFRYNGSVWEKLDHVVPDYVLGVWGTAGGQMRAVGSIGEVFRGVRGATATSASVSPAGATQTVISGTRTFTARAIDSDGNVVTPGTPFTWSSENTVIATVDPGTGVATAQSSGQAAIKATSGSLSAYGVYTVAATGSPAVSAFSNMITPGAVAMWDIWGSSGTNAIAVGGGGTIWRYNGTSWSADPQSGTVTTAGLWSVSGTSASDMHAVGSGNTLLHFNGTTWSVKPAPAGISSHTVYRVWAATPDAAFAAQGTGYVLRWNGSVWDTLPRVTTALLSGVWGSSTNDVWAVGTSGVIRRWDGVQWNDVSHPVGTETIRAVWGTSSGNVYVATSGGNVLQCNASSCAAMPLPGVGDMWDIWGNSSSEIFVASISGAIARWNGVSWSTMLTGYGTLLRGIWGTSSGTVFVAGQNTAQPVLRGVRGAPVQSYGYSTKFAGTDFGWWTPGDLGSLSITVTDTLVVTHLGLIVHTAGTNVKMGLYTDASGAPGTLVTQGTGTVTSVGVQEIPVTQTTVLPGTYWIATNFQNVTYIQANLSLPITHKYRSSFGYANPLPSPFGVASTTTYQALNYYVKGFRF